MKSWHHLEKHLKVLKVYWTKLKTLLIAKTQPKKRKPKLRKLDQLPEKLSMPLRKHLLHSFPLCALMSELREKLPHTPHTRRFNISQPLLRI